MYCKNCGKLIKNGSSYCKYCGMVINSGETAKRSKKKVLVFVVIILILSAVAVFGIVLLKDKKENKETIYEASEKIDNNGQNEDNEIE